MSFGFRRSLRFGPLRLNLSRRGLSSGVKIGPVSTNSRTRRLRISGPFGSWWLSKPWRR